MKKGMWFIIIFFIILFFAVNGFLYFSFEEKSLIWGYCSTDTFKTVSVSILIAVFLVAIGGYLKIDKAIEERIREQRQKRIDAQTECIKMTTDMWNELYCLASEVRFLKKDGNIEDVLVKLENFASRAEDVINTWNFNFPKLYKIERKLTKRLEEQLRMESNNRKKALKTQYGKDKKTELKEELEKEKLRFNNVLEKIKNIDASAAILVFINVLYDATISAAHYSRTYQKKEQLSNLRNSLGVIQDVIKDIAHHRIINILKYFVEPVDDREAKEQEKTKSSQFEKTLYNLHSDAIAIKQFEKTNNVLLSGIQTPNADAFRKEAALFEEWEKAKGSREISMVDYERYKYFDTSYNDIKDKQFVDAWEIKYSDEYLLKLAVWLGNMSIKLNLKDRAAWL